MVDTFNVAQVPVFNALIPKDGPKALPVNYNFTVQSSYYLDLQNYMARDYIGFIQSIFVDNSLNTAPVSITFAISNQKIQVGAYQQGYFPVLVPNPLRVTVSSQGGTSCQIQYLNVPVPSHSWNATNQTFNFDGSGNLLVSDTILEGAVSSGYFRARMFALGNSDAVIQYRIPNVTTQITMTGATTNTTVLTGTPRFYLNALVISLSGDASLAAAGNLVVSVRQNTTVLAQASILLPSAPDIVPQYAVMKMEGLQYVSTVNSETLNVLLSAALATGTLYGTFAGGLTAGT